MALHAATVGEIRGSGNNNNSGLWHDTGGASVDYSQQDAAELTLTDVVTDGTTTVTSVTGGFTDAMVGNIINILTKGRFEIAARTDTNTITVDRNAIAGTGLSASVGGCVADLEEIDNVIVAGNDVHIKAGTYNLAGAILTSAGVNGTGVIRFLGYKTTRGDEPAEADMPLMAAGANAITFNSLTLIKFLNFTSTETYGVNLGSYASAEQCKCHNSSGSANRAAFTLSAATELIKCTAISDSGYAVNVAAADAVIMHNRMYSSVRGIHIANHTPRIIGNIIRECTAYGIYLGSNWNFALIMDNTIDDDVIGIYFANSHYATVRNNSISHNSEEGVKSQAASYGIRLNKNNFHDNNPDVTNVLKGLDTMSYDPDYTGEDDYSLPVTSDLYGAGEVIELDVG